MEGRTTCAMDGCTLPISGANNLCDEHRLPGMAFRLGKSTAVITAWYTEHGNEIGVIVLNDWTLGALFAGREGFEAKLREQGFTAVRNIGTPEELESAIEPPRAGGSETGLVPGGRNTCDTAHGILPAGLSRFCVRDFP
jgi:hypothetical protein